MKKKDETLKWIDDEIRRIKNTATRSQNWIDGKFYGGLDPTNQMQIDILEKQKEEYLKGLQNQ